MRKGFFTSTKTGGIFGNDNYLHANGGDYTHEKSDYGLDMSIILQNLQRSDKK